MHTTEHTVDFFWEVADSFLSHDCITRSTMMGFPCLRINGQFFASVEPKSGHLVVKLPATRVQEMIDIGIGQPFAPAGRKFREWVLVADRDTNHWEELLAEAHSFVEAA